MPKTLLAVDDSSTMRKVLEITFSGEDFKVITVEGAQAALGKMNEEPRVVLIDTSLGSDDGYALCKEIRRRDGSAGLILLSSRHNPYDQAKGRDAGADDYMDKPFDTQQMIDKVRKVLLAKESAPAQSAAAPAPSPAAPSVAARPQSLGPQPPAPAATRAPQPSRGHTLMFGEAGSPAPPPAAHAPGPMRPPQATSPQSFVPQHQPMAARPAPAPAPAPVHAPPPAPPTPIPAHAPVATPVATPAASAKAAISASTNGQLAGKLGDLGLSPAQADAVLALSREVVERVVWEVVPQLAEALIKEEIARLTKEG